MLCVITTIRLLQSVDGPNKGQKLTQVHKVNGPHEGSRLQSTKWMDPTRVKLHKFTTWMDLTKGQDSSPQSGRTPQGSNLHKSTMWTDPIKGQDSSPQSGRTPKGSNIHKSTTWTDLMKGQDSSPQCGRTPQGSNLHKVHIVDGHHEGSRFQPITWTNPT